MALATVSVFYVSKKLRIVTIVGLGLSIILIAAIGSLYWACQRQPPFYSAALGQDAVAAHSASDSLTRQTLELASDVRRQGRWQAQFTVDQINGWLTDAGHRNRDRLFSPHISDPRVAIDTDRVQVAFRWTRPAWSAIVNLEAEIYLQESNVVAVRIHQARAGLLPLPLSGLINDLISAGREFGLEITARQIDGDPLLLVSLPQEYDRGKRSFRLEALELTKGQIYVAGRSENAGLDTRPVAKQPAAVPAVQAHAEKQNIQR